MDHSNQSHSNLNRPGFDSNQAIGHSGSQDRKRGFINSGVSLSILSRAPSFTHDNLGLVRLLTDHSLLIDWLCVCLIDGLNN